MGEGPGAGHDTPRSGRGAGTSRSGLCVPEPPGRCNWREAEVGMYQHVCGTQQSSLE